MSPRGWFAVSVVCYGLAVGYASLGLPSGNVALHFGADGTADRFGTKTEAMTFLCVLGVLLTALLGGLAHATDIGRSSTTFLNVPHKEYWTHPAREARMRELMAADLYRIGAVTMVLVAVVALEMVSAARTGGSLGPWGWIATLAYVLFMVGWMVHAYTARYLPTEEA